MANRRFQHRRRLVPRLWVMWLTLALVVSAATVAFAKRDVADIAEDEITAIESHGFVIPERTIVAVNWWALDAFTVIAAKPVKYVVVLRAWYWREGQTHYTAAHELAHVVFDYYGLPQDEDKADEFSACFGTDAAKEWATTVEKITPDCEAFSKAVQ